LLAEVEAVVRVDLEPEITAQPQEVSALELAVAAEEAVAAKLKKLHLISMQGRAFLLQLEMVERLALQVHVVKQVAQVAQAEQQLWE
jgi:hypothetical protein